MIPLAISHSRPSNSQVYFPRLPDNLASSKKPNLPTTQPAEACIMPIRHRSLCRLWKLLAVLILASFTATSGLLAQVPQLTGAPEPIQKLAADLQGKPAQEVREEIITRFGPAQRNIGSGFRIEQWDLSEGVLTFHPIVGPSFKDQAGKLFRLMRTTNPVGKNILDSYEMTTLPDPDNYGNRFWLGNVKFGADGSYLFVDSKQHAEHRTNQRGNFFIEHPEGTVAVRYPEGITADTLLESLPEDTMVARLEFLSADGKNKATFSIKSSERARTLTFSAESPLSFAMDTSWQNYWQ